jgi:phosphatidylglycerophosphatase C
MAESPSPVAAFDFDGTLTIKDSFTAFLAWRAGPWRHALGLARLAPHALAYLLHRDRGRLKAAAAAEFLKGLSRQALEADAEAFAEVMAPRLFRPDALKVWNGWGERGVTRAIVTASPDLVVAPFARRLGAEVLIGTRLAFDAGNHVTGAFASENCRGEEKMVRLRARFGPDLRLIAAYGDTGGDAAMLAAAEEAGYRVFKEKP